MAYTPGPWNVFHNANARNERPGIEAFGTSIVIWGDGGDREDFTGIFGRNDNYQEGLENAYLIAASPDLLEALELHVAYEAVPTDRGGSQGPKGKAWAAFVEARDAAIKKAKGL